ncbi:unnamed protein product [Rhodiola kirilowii]
MLDGLRRLDQKLLDASAGGTIMNLSPAEVRKKIMEVAENARFQDKSNKEEEFSRPRNISKADAPSSSMAEEIKQLKKMMIQVIGRQPAQVKACGFCDATDHKTDACPTIVEHDQGEVNTVGEYQSYGNRNEPTRQDAAQHATPQQNQQHYRLPHRQYQQNAPGQYQQRGSNQNQAGPSNQGPNKSFEDIVKELAASTHQLATTVHQNQAKTYGAIADLSRQMSQIATTVSELKNNPGRLPSQTIQNPRGNVSAVTLRSGKNMTAVSTEPAENDSPPTTEEEPAGPEILGTSRPDMLGTSRPGPTPATETSRPDLVLVSGNTNSAHLPFLVQVRAPKQYVMDKNVWELFSKVEINIPLLEAI